MPVQVFGTGFESEQTAAEAFWYVEAQTITFSGEAGGVFTTTDGVVVTIPPQGVSGVFVITMTPQVPESGTPGNVLDAGAGPAI